MKRLLLIGVYATIALSCTREAEPVKVPSHDGIKEETVRIDPSSVDLAAQPGVALVYLTDEYTMRMESDPSFISRQVKDFEINSMERLFPYAGEYEPRTRREGLHRWYIVQFDNRTAVSKALESLSAVSGVELAEISPRIKETATINDPYWNQMWGMNNTAFPGYDVNCQKVWDEYTTGNPDVVVAVVDGGLQLDHPDLKDNIAASGHYNYVNGNTTILQHFHGVHVGGTIAAINNNSLGVTGIAGGDKAKGQGGVKLLSLQVFRSNADGSTSSAHSFATALKEAADKGAHISQNSWGYVFDFNDNGVIDSGTEMEYARYSHENPERSFTQAVDYFNKYAGCDNNGNQLSDSPMKGGVVIFAAGNDNIQYGAPGNYDGCVSVGAIQKSGSRASFSNWGEWVDLCAPGQDIVSTYLNGKYATMSGTSMACPHVSGVAALVVSYFAGEGFTSDELRARLTGGARVIPASTGTRPVGPLVDAYGAFQVRGDDKTPPPVKEYTLSPSGHNLKLDFTASDAYGYLALASENKSSLENVDLQHPADDIITVTRIMGAQETEGSPVSVQLNGLQPDTDYYVAVVAFSYSRKYSALSPIKSAHTNKNNPPEITPSIPLDQFQFHHYEVVDVPIIIKDPDGDDISIDFETNGRATLESTDGAVGIQHFRLLCPVVSAPASFKATVTVKDDIGATTSLVINYSVLANVAPAQVQEFPTVVLKGKGETAKIDLTEYMQDPDGEPLDFRAASSKVSIVSAAIEDENTLVLKAVDNGRADINISGTDADGLTVKSLLMVIVREGEEGAVTFEDSDFNKTGVLTIIPVGEKARITVRVISSSGVVVYTHTGDYGSIDPLSLDLKALAPGIYTVEVSYQGQVFTYTIVKR